ncbi:autoinducer-binding transcriptional regulator TraR (plasmid) [Agrobacterium sp. rho-13.3]|uniref:autoinducer-binding transcriptional regulator TraR n=1 Tax=Agrobacterium sp. rho-13.3 TaxID=3072980 RepID=UPI002A152992|nr:transcriptional regulator TraR [Agrobacterium sp. rho-13.3]MDX8310163.1 transcriptional regulator TraR [Agrobacterium sp. rho-13.3]
MQHWLDKLTDLTVLKGGLETFELALADFARRNGFVGYAYLNLEPNHTYSVSSYREEWKAKYSEKKFLTLDPVVKRAKSLKRLFVWSGQQDITRLSKAERSFYAQADDFGLRSGITIPVKTAYGSMAMFTLASDTRTIDLEREIDPVFAGTAVAQLHTRIASLPMPPSAEDHAYLEPSEATYLRWIAIGKSPEDVAALEGVKYNSVRVKLASTKKRFNVHTIAHLMAVVVRLKLI